MPLEIRSQRGAPSKVIVERLKAFAPTQDDLVAMGVLLQSRTFERTGSGIDRWGSPFQDYSDTGPIYIDIGAKSGAGRTTKQKRSAAQRFARKVGLSGKIIGKARKSPTAKAADRVKEKVSTAPKSFTARGKFQGPFKKINPDKKKGGVTPIGGVTPGGYLKVASYRDFKFNVLGRAVVDLLGHRAPHMLHQLVVKLQGSGAAVAPRTVPNNPTPASLTKPSAVLVGFFGEIVGQALAHAEGRGRLPKRDFFGIGRGDSKALIGELRRRVRIRQSRL